MVLVSEDVVDNVIFKFYFGIDFNLAKSHPKDGSGGMMVIFVESYVDEEIIFKKETKRENKIGQIFGDISNIELDIDIIMDNSYVVIYQTGNNMEKIYESIRSRMLVPMSTNFPWYPVGRDSDGKIISGVLINSGFNI